MSRPDVRDGFARLGTGLVCNFYLPFLYSCWGGRTSGRAMDVVGAEGGEEAGGWRTVL